MMLRFFGYLFGISFLLNFVWEISQMPFYQPHGWGQVAVLPEFIQLHWIVSLKDAAMVVILYVAVGLVLRNMYWGRHLTKKGCIPFVVLGFLWAVAIEYYRTSVTYSWAYAASMPLIPLLGVGFWPVLQMVILPSVAVLLSRKHLFS